MSNLTNHAQKELQLAGLFDADSDYSGMIGEAVMELIKVFSKQGHSGASASMVRQIFHRVANFENLTPLTDKPEEWMAIGDGQSQSVRHSTCFSNDNGKTYYDIDDKKRKIYTSKHFSYLKAGD